MTRSIHGQVYWRNISPAQRREQERRRELQRAATRIIKAADRAAPGPQARRAPSPPPPESSPRRYTLSDLPLLRKQGLGSKLINCGAEARQS
jgi:hypothetical protein